MEWREVTCEDDLKLLSEAISNFHDSSLSEVHVWRDTWVSAEGTIHNAGEASVHARLLFQQMSAFELWFDDVVHIQVVEIPANYDQFMLSAALFQHEGLYYWSDDDSWTPDAPRPTRWETSGGLAHGPATWVGARRLKWRELKGGMGEQLRYGPRPDTE